MIKRGINRRKGAAMVEFSLTIPVYIMAIFCFLQLALIIHARIVLTYASFTAARAGIVYNAREQEMKRAVLTVLSPFFGRIHEGENDSLFDIDFMMFRQNEVFEDAYDDAEDEWDDDNIRLEIIAPDDARARLRSAQTLNSEFGSNERFLHVRVHWNFPMVIPLANNLFHTFLNSLDSGVDSKIQPGYYLAGAERPDDPRFPLFSDYRLRLTGINKQNPYHD